MPYPSVAVISNNSISCCHSTRVSRLILSGVFFEETVFFPLLSAAPFVQKKRWRRRLGSVSLNCRIVTPRARVYAHTSELNTTTTEKSRKPVGRCCENGIQSAEGRMWRMVRTKSFTSIWRKFRTTCCGWMPFSGKLSTGLRSVQYVA